MRKTPIAATVSRPRPEAGRSIPELLPKFYRRFQAAGTQSQFLLPKTQRKATGPRLTLEPFAKAAKLKIDTRFGNSQSADLAADLRANQQGKVILICWRHPYIPDSAQCIGSKPQNFLPNGKWPGAVFNWVIQLSFDQDGHLIPSSSRRIDEHLMPGSSQ